MNLLDTTIHLFHPRRANNHRPKLLHSENIFSLSAIALGFAIFILVSNKINPHVGYILGYASNISTADVVSMTNQQRAAAGLSPLVHNTKLSQAAAAKAQDMLAKQYWAHQSPEGMEPWAFISASGYTYVAAGENLARDFMNTSDMVSAWMASPTHRANIMNARYQEIGVAAVNGTLQGMETTLVVQMFGRPSSSNVVAQVSPKAAASPDQTPDPVSLHLAETQPSVTPQNEQDKVLLEVSEPSPEILTSPEMEKAVLAQTLVSGGTISPQTGRFSPLSLVKAFSLGLLFLLIAILSYDWFIAHNHGTVRLVGKNLAHIVYLLTISIIILVFKGGFVN